MTFDNPSKSKRPFAAPVKKMPCDHGGFWFPLIPMNQYKVGPPSYKMVYKAH